MNLSVSEILGTLFGEQPAPPSVIVVATGIAAVAVVAVNLVWRWARNIITIAHEGGHALVALLTGRRLNGIRLHADTSGLTYSQGQRRGLSATLTLMAGYLAPALLGLGAAFLVSRGLVVLLLWIMLALLAAMALFIRNAFGIAVIVVVGFGVFAVAWWADTDVRSTLAHLGAWFLLVGAVRPVWEVWRQRARGKATDSDPDQLADITGVPALLWLLLFALVNVAALALGADLLLPELW